MLAGRPVVRCVQMASWAVEMTAATLRINNMHSPQVIQLYKVYQYKWHISIANSISIVTQRIYPLGIQSKLLQQRTSVSVMADYLFLSCHFELTIDQNDFYLIFIFTKELHFGNKSSWLVIERINFQLYQCIQVSERFVHFKFHIKVSGIVNVSNGFTCHETRPVKA